jgi:hypothetical protein
MELLNFGVAYFIQFIISAVTRVALFGFGYILPLFAHIPLLREEKNEKNAV